MVQINGQNMYAVYGVKLEEGNYPQLLKHPKKKDGYIYNWADGSGEDYDSFAPVVFETSLYNLSFLIVASSKADLLQKYSTFIAILVVSAGSVWTFTELNKTVKLHYVEATSFEEINFYSGSARIVIQFKNRHEL